MTELTQVTSPLFLAATIHHQSLILNRALTYQLVINTFILIKNHQITVKWLNIRWHSRVEFGQDLPHWPNLGGLTCKEVVASLRMLLQQKVKA